MLKKLAVLMICMFIFTMVCGCDNDSKSKTDTENTDESTTVVTTEATTEATAEVTTEVATQSTTETTAEVTTSQPATSKVTVVPSTAQPATTSAAEKSNKKQQTKPEETKPKEQETKSNPNSSVSKPRIKNSSVSKPRETAKSKPKNSYTNYNNYRSDLYKVTVKPKYVRYSGKKIIADCYITNGLGCTVNNICVNNFKLRDNKKKVICSADFGTLENVTISPYSYVEWTFTFRADCVDNSKASLKKLSWGSNITFDYKYQYGYYYGYYCW
ncbi:MAG: hypothetical protein IJV39_01370 [Ruminococcus sp.]|nr:hypothetical protein [Ruminococcus sp.]